ncbi:hypothetical protein M0R45_008225 [Rubus argutus]|uniref:Uncharacterized protein n=1 Tax=Rubus argutus TaxID=59490 RepID=A0AAW1Y3G5_RUBAR
MAICSSIFGPVPFAKFKTPKSTYNHQITTRLHSPPALCQLKLSPTQSHLMASPIKASPSFCPNSIYLQPSKHQNLQINSQSSTIASTTSSITTHQTPCLLSPITMNQPLHHIQTALQIAPHPRSFLPPPSFRRRSLLSPEGDPRPPHLPSTDPVPLTADSPDGVVRAQPRRELPSSPPWSSPLPPQEAATPTNP